MASPVNSIVTTALSLPALNSDELLVFTVSSTPHPLLTSPQGNGLVERTVQTIKNLLTKPADTGGDFYLALLDFRASPHETMTLSPAQLLMGRRLRTTLPSLPSVLQPELASLLALRERDRAKKQQHANYYNRRYGARELPELQPGDAVLIWDMNRREWRIPATVQNKVHDRSYRVVTPTGAVFRRSRHQLQLRQQPANPLQREPAEEDDIQEMEGNTQVALEQESQPPSPGTVDHMHDAGATVTRHGRLVRLPVLAFRQITLFCFAFTCTRRGM